MKDINKNLNDLEISSVIRACLDEMFQPGDTEECKSKLEVASSYLSHAICHDPIFSLFDEKNIFSLINNFFTKFALKKMGCESATEIIVPPLKKIQGIACDVIATKKNSFTNLVDNLGVESMDAGCSLSILPETNEGLQSCYPSYDFNVTQAEKLENIIATEEVCLGVVKNLPIGERIKLCDDFIKAMECSSCDIYEATRELLKMMYPNNKNISEEQMQNFLIIPKYYKKLKGLESDNRRINAREKANKILSGETIIENSACKSLATIRKPFIALNKSCSANEIPFKNDFNVEPIYSSCEKTIGALAEEEKETICENPSFFFRNIPLKAYFDKALRVIQPVCDTFLTTKKTENDELQETLNLITASNAANIFLMPQEELNPVDNLDTHVSLLIPNKLASINSSPNFQLIQSDSSHNTVDFRSGAIVAGAGVGLIGLGGIVGYGLFKLFQKLSKTVASNPDESELPLNNFGRATSSTHCA